MASQQQKKCLYIIWGPFQRLFFSHKKMLLFISLYLTIVFFFPPYIAIAAVVSLFYLLYFFLFYFVVKQRMNEQKKTFWEQTKNMLQNIIIRVAHGRVEESRKKLLLLFCTFQLKNQLIMLYRVCIILFLCASGVCFSSHTRAALYHSYVHKKTSY